MPVKYIGKTLLVVSGKINIEVPGVTLKEDSDGVHGEAKNISIWRLTEEEKKKLMDKEWIG